MIQPNIEKVGLQRVWLPVPFSDIPLERGRKKNRGQRFVPQRIRFSKHVELIKRVSPTLSFLK